MSCPEQAAILQQRGQPELPWDRVGRTVGDEGGSPVQGRAGWGLGQPHSSRLAQSGVTSRGPAARRNADQHRGFWVRTHQEQLAGQAGCGAAREGAIGAGWGVGAFTLPLTSTVPGAHLCTSLFGSEGQTEAQRGKGCHEDHTAHWRHARTWQP